MRLWPIQRKTASAPVSRPPPRMRFSNLMKLSTRRAVGGVLALAFAWAGCVSDKPRRTVAPPRALAQTNRAAAILPPPRIRSEIAPPPESAFEPKTNAPATLATKSLHDGIAELKAAPPQPEKIYSFTAKDLEVKDALALFARNNDLNIVPDPDISAQVTVDIRNLPLEKSMEAVLDTFGYYADIDGGLIRVRKTKTEFFTVDYVRLTRSGNGSSAATVSSSSSSGGGGAGAGPSAPAGGATPAGGAGADGAS